ncbi:MAG: hypothetical protein HY782_14115 [Chloroflexi bacterium]|nr:hypothetical protein [Chloroflexota bacterium]
MHLARHLILLALVGLVLALAILALPALTARADLTQGTVTDFNSGTFYHTGLTKTTNGGGDGDGEVRLMTVGISAAEWKSDGNATGLAALQGHAVIQKNGRIYISGGGTPGSLNGTTYVSYTTILSTTNHNLSNWSGTSALSYAVKQHGMAAVNNYVYVIGGQVGLVPTSTVSFAPINGNGTLGAWTSSIQSPGSIAPLPGIRSEFATVVVSDTIYVIGGGGTDNNPQSTVYYAKPNANGTISSWSTSTVPLPLALKQLAAATYNGVIYIVGGYDGTTYYPNVYYVTPTGTGNITNAWTSAPAVAQQSIILASGATFGGQLYIAGGAYNNGTNLLNTVASNLLMTDGSLSNWVNSDVLSTARQLSAAVVSDDGWLYVIEGNPGTGIDPLNTIDYGPLSAPGGSYTSPGTYTSAVIDLGASQNVLGLDWNTTVTLSQGALTMQYRYGSSQDLSAASWSTASPAGNGFLITNTIAFSQSARYWQYRATFTTTVASTSPILNWVRLKYNQPPVITQHPVSQIVDAGQVVTFTAAATSSPAPTVQWQVSTDGGGTWSPVTGADSTTLGFTGGISATLSFTTQSSQNGYKYRAVFTNGSASATTSAATLSIAPDFTITGIQSPAPTPGASTSVSQTINVYVSNLGNQSFRSPTQSTTAIVTQHSAPKGTTRKPPSLSARTYGGTTNDWFWVDVYVTDLPGATVPTTPGDTGNCPAQGGGTSYNSVQHLGAGQYVVVPVVCWLPAGQSHTFYAQVDTCDDPSGNSCSLSYGYILERKENNNIFGPVSSGSSPPTFLYLPLIRK